MKKNYLSLLIIVLALTACAKRFETDMAVPALVSTELRIVSEDQTGFYAMNENTIGDVNLFLFGDFNYHFYFALSTPVISFEVLPGSYKMYLITNAHRDIGMLAKQELLAYDIASESMFDNEDIPMTAEVLLTVGNSGIPSPAEIPVKRCAAKIIYNIEVATEVASSIKLSSVQFCNLPRKIRPFGNGSISSTIPGDYYDSEIISLGGHTVGSGIQYLFENCQGTVASITDQKDKSPVNAPACAAYMCILAQGSNEVIEYIVFLGENNTSDFNVRRNTKHEMNLVIQGKSEIDFRVKVFEGLYYGTANSIICNGYQVSFDVTPYRTSRALHYKYTNVYAGKEYEPVSAKVVWQGAANLISSLSLKNNLLTVNTNGRKGNAVLAVCDKTGAVLWSFHIWCTAGDSPQDVLCRNYAKAQFYAMDRNLGAFANNPASYVDAAGLIYQWGRKDPFPSTNEDNVYTPTTSGSFISVFPIKEFYKDASAPFDVLIEQYRQNPATFVKINYGDMWRSESVSLWGDPEGHMNLANNKYNTDVYAWSSDKSVYDPCPEGYRVANRFTWTGFSKDGSTLIGDNNFGGYLTETEINIVGGWNYGWLLRTTPTSSQTIYYPATQNRNLGGKLSAYNFNSKVSSSYYWSSAGAYENVNGVTDATDRANCMRFQGNQMILSSFKNGNSSGMDPGFGFSVRCVRE